MKSLIEHLENNVSDDVIFTLWNEYAIENYPDDYLFNSIEEIVEIMQFSPYELACKVYFGNIQSWNDDYFFFNGYANIESLCSLTADNSPVDFSLLAEWLQENNRLDDVDYDEEDL